MLRHAIWAIALVGCTSPVHLSTTDQADTVCAAGPTVNGMDVSYYDDVTDWNAAKAAGIDFAFIRVTDGTQYQDPTFAGYWAAAKAAGVIRGAYQYFRPAEDPIAQADLLLQLMGPLDPGDLPPVLDLEVSGGLDTADVTAAAQAWVDHIAAAIGRQPIVYAGLYSWPTLTDSADFTTSPLWIAQYTTAACPDIPLPWTQWLFWQDSDTGTADGITGSTLDLDVFDGTLADLQAFGTGGTCGDGVCSGGETTATCIIDCPPCGTIAAAGGEIDDGDPCFTAGGPPAYLRYVTGAGEMGDLIWTHATDAATEANFAQWNLYLATPGNYQVDVYTAQPYAQSKQAKYVIEAAGASSSVVIDQSAVDGWQTLGPITFAAGGDQWIHLGDNTGELPADNIQLVFDAIRLTSLDDGSGGSGSDMGSDGDGDGSTTHHHDCSTSGGGSGLIVGLAALLVVRRRRRD